MKCADCGQPLHQAAWNSDLGTYVRVEPKHITGRKKEHCALCGKARLVPSAKGKRVETDTEYWKPWPNESEKQMVKAEEMVCWHHAKVDYES